MSANRKDLPHVGAPNFLNRVRETLQGYLGTSGSVLDRGVTVRDLADAGIVRVNPTFLSSGTGTPIVGVGSAVANSGGSTTVVVGGGGTSPTYVPDLTKPPAPTGFFVGGGISSLQGGVAAPTYTVGHGHDRCVVYGVSYTSGPLPTFSSAVELTRFTGSIFFYPTTPATTWHLWVTHQSVDGVESDPAGGLHGLVVTSGQDIPLVLSALSGEIDESYLTPDLAADIAGASSDASGALTLATSASDAAAWLGDRYVVRTTLSVDGRTLVGGFSLAGTNSASQGPEIEFGVAANRFWIGAPQVPGSSGLSSIKPFVVQTTDTVTPNGVSIPKGVYMDAAFIVNLEAAVARLGQAWINTAMIGEAQIVAAQIQSVNADTITTGQLAAERINGRGLLIQNENGTTLLDARGSAVPPWLVLVENSQEAGAWSLAAPPDTTNRASLRGLKFDGTALRAQYSTSGNSIEIIAAATEMWRVTYAASMPVFIADGIVFLDRSQLALLPNTAYRISFRLFPRSVSTVSGTARFYLDLPLGCDAQISNGQEIVNHNGVIVDLGSFPAPTAAPNVFERTYSQTVPTSPSTTVNVPNTLQGVLIQAIVKTGGAGGIVRLHASAGGQNLVIYKGSEFVAHRLPNYVVPEVVAETQAVLNDLATVGKVGSSDLTAVTGQSYKAIQVVNYSIPSSTPINVVYGGVTSITLRREVATDNVLLVLESVNFWSGSNPPFSDALVNANILPGKRLASASRLLTGLPSAESNRWTFRLRRVPVVNPSAYPEAEFVIDNIVLDESNPVDPENLSTLPFSAGVTTSTGAYNRQDLGQHITDFGVTAYFMGTAVGPEQFLRVVTNVQ